MESQKKLSDIPNEYIRISFFNDFLYTHTCISNMCHAYSILIIDIRIFPTK